MKTAVPSCTRDVSELRGMVTINSSTGEVSYNEDYYAIATPAGSFSPGPYRVDSTAFGFGGIENAAFVNPDGSLVVSRSIPRVGR